MSANAQNRRRRAANHAKAPPPAPPATDRPWHDPRRGLWIAALAAVVSFLPALWNGFTYDDQYIVERNERIRSLTNLPEIWTSDWWQPPAADASIVEGRRDRLYRPLTMTTFALNHAVHGLWPAGFLAVNLALHVAATLLVWQLARRLLSDDAVAMMSAFIFAVHPVHAEAIANVVGRAELLSALLLIVGLLLLVPAQAGSGWQRATRWLAASVCFAGALFAKESAVCYFPIAVLVLWRGPLSARLTGLGRWVVAALLLAWPLAVYFPLRYHALGGHLVRTTEPTFIMNPLVAADFGERVIGALTILGHYVRLMIVPATLASDYGYATIRGAAVVEWLTLVGVAALLTGVAVALQATRRAGPWQQAGLLVLIAGLSYGLISNAVILIGVTVAERLLYWPSVPLSMLIAMAIIGSWRRWYLPGVTQPSRLLSIVGIVLLVSLGLRSMVRSMDWRDNLTLFAMDVQTHPRSVHLRDALAEELMLTAVEFPTADPRRADMLAAAAEHTQTALEIAPGHIDALKLRGVIALLRGDEALASELLELAARLGPLDEETVQWAARVRGSLPGHEQRLAELSQALTTRPASVPLRIELAETQLNAGQYAAALQTLAPLADAGTDDPRLLDVWARVLIANDRLDAATAALQRLVEIEPENWAAQTNLGALLVASDPEGAVAHARRAVELEPERLETQLNLAEVLLGARRHDEARQQYQRVLRLMPAEHPLRPAVEAQLREIDPAPLP